MNKCEVYHFIKKIIGKVYLYKKKIYLCLEIEDENMNCDTEFVGLFHLKNNYKCLNLTNFYKTTT